MMNDRQLWALTHPLDSGVTAEIVKRRTVTRQSDGTLLVVILAVDR